MNVQRSALVLVLALLMPPAAAEASTILFSNGAITGTSPGVTCDSGPGVCGGSGTWTYYDNFILSGQAIVTGFDYTDFFATGTPANYVQTNWSIYTDPLDPGAPIASGSSVATVGALALPGSPFLFTVSGLNLNLAAGTYWLGINNLMNGAFATAPAESAGVLSGAKQGDGGSFFFDFRAERGFSVYGSPVPEPSTWLLLGTGLAAVAARRRFAKRT